MLAELLLEPGSGGARVDPGHSRGERGPAVGLSRSPTQRADSGSSSAPVASAAQSYSVVSMRTLLLD